MEEGYGEWPSFLGLPSHLQRSRELRGKRCENTGWTSDGVKLPSKMKVRKLFDKGLNAVDYYTKELTKKAVCSSQAVCDGRLATIKCHHCIKYDHLRVGFYCNECFQVKHPAYRAKHYWESIDVEKDKQQEWLRHVARTKMEEDLGELTLLLEQTENFRENVENLGIELQSENGIHRATKDLERLDHSISKMMDKVQDELRYKYMTNDEAIERIQSMWKIRQARKVLCNRVRKVYDRFQDPKSKKYYYYNKATKQTTWFKPVLLGSQDFIETKPRTLACDLTPQTASILIQRSIRYYLARCILFHKLESRYEKLLDGSTNNHYYLNRQTNQVSWHKPKLLRHQDLYTPRTKAKKARERHIKFRKMHPLTIHDAACILQRMVRCHRYRIYYRKLLSSVYEKIYNPEVGQYFYHNSITGAVSWTRPANLTDDHLLTPRARRASTLLQNPSQP